MLSQSAVEANIPVADLDRARQFYADRLGLTPVAEFFEGETLRYKTDTGTYFNVYRTQYAGQAGHTIAQLHVDDVDQEVADLTAKGVEFETYDMPGVEWNDKVANIPGMGKAAWFKDSEGNILCIDDGPPSS
jgi:catechol 2,3-dioxygenase-like lactoylglutathione lyase family enzyme